VTPRTPAWRDAAWYTAIAYAVSWACWLPLAATGRIVDIGGWPTHLPGLLGPAIAAFALTWLAHGRPGVRALTARILHWRTGRWWLVALSPLLLLGAGLAARAATGDGLSQWADLWRINGFPPPERALR
jgi:hypothetical protein